MQNNNDDILDGNLHGWDLFLSHHHQNYSFTNNYYHESIGIIINLEIILLMIFIHFDQIDFKKNEIYKISETIEIAL